MNSPDNVCANAATKGIKITTIKKDGFVLIEGSKEALLFLSQLIEAQANFVSDDGFHISPQGAGNALFSDASDVGLYINRVD